MNQTDNTYSNEEEQNIYMVGSLVCACVLIVIAIFGIIGNVLTLLVFIQPMISINREMSSINVLLAGQAVMDIVLLITGTPLFATMGIIAYQPSEIGAKIISILVPYIYPIAMYAQLSTIWIAVIITCERYLAVCKPFKALTACAPENAKIALITINVISAAYNVCRFWEYQRLNDFDLSPLLKDNYYYIEYYYHWLYFLTSFLLPFVILVALNGFIIKTIFIAKRKRRKASRQQYRQHKTSIMILVVTCTFLVCNVLAFILNAMDAACLTSAKPPEYCMESYYDFMIDLNNVLVEINSSIPFLIFVSFSRCFRIQLHKVVTRYWRKSYELASVLNAFQKQREANLCMLLMKQRHNGNGLLDQV